ncbi:MULTISPECIES: hypothetical protein [unclassified Variovorax]|uniref:hypothetical protein n=1 Tax=unclassified Variovorax TaxID=663243 RepID=UPI003F488F7E
MIDITYRVEVPMPAYLLDMFGRDTDFLFALTQATRGHSAAGRATSVALGSYEWGEFRDKKAAETCERDLLAVVARFEARHASDHAH